MQYRRFGIISVSLSYKKKRKKQLSDSFAFISKFNHLKNNRYI